MENRLLQRCIEGDRLSQMEFYDSLCHSIYNTCYRILGNREQAQEVTHESFIKIFTAMHRYAHTPEAIANALRRIAINGSIDILRRRKVIFVEADESLTAEQQSDATYNELTVDRIKQAIGRLPDGYRVVATLRLIEQMEYSEIAEELNIGLSTVRSQYKRAIDKIKQML